MYVTQEYKYKNQSYINRQNKNTIQCYIMLYMCIVACYTCTCMNVCLYVQVLLICVYVHKILYVYNYVHVLLYVYMYMYI